MRLRGRAPALCGFVKRMWSVACSNVLKCAFTSSGRRRRPVSKSHGRTTNTVMTATGKFPSHDVLATTAYAQLIQTSGKNM
eukprot:1191136-Prorocentrum_minimum.AAC.2